MSKKYVTKPIRPDRARPETWGWGWSIIVILLFAVGYIFKDSGAVPLMKQPTLLSFTAVGVIAFCAAYIGGFGLRKRGLAAFIMFIAWVVLFWDVGGFLEFERLGVIQ